MIFKTAQIALGIRVKPLLQKLRDNASLDFKRTRRHVHHMIQPCKKLVLAGRKVRNPRHIYRHHADASRTLARAEEAARLFPKLTQIQTQSAAHAPHVGGLHVRIDIIRKIRRTVLCGHLK